MRENGDGAGGRIRHAVSMFDHEQLHIWRRSHALAVEIHFALRGRARFGPAGLSAQLSRACASIAANIAECAGQETAAQSARFMDVAIGSSSETQSHLAFASATGLLRPQDASRFSAEVQEIRRMCFAFKKWLLLPPLDP